MTAVIRVSLELIRFRRMSVSVLRQKARQDQVPHLGGGGFLLLYKRLLDGRYQWPRSKQEVMEMTQEQFEWLMSGQTILPSIRKAKPKNML